MIFFNTISLESYLWRRGCVLADVGMSRT